MGSEVMFCHGCPAHFENNCDPTRNVWTMLISSLPTVHFAGTLDREIILEAQTILILFTVQTKVSGGDEKEEFGGCLWPLAKATH